MVTGGAERWFKWGVAQGWKVSAWVVKKHSEDCFHNNTSVLSGLNWLEMMMVVNTKDSQCYNSEVREELCVSPGSSSNHHQSHSCPTEKGTSEPCLSVLPNQVYKWGSRAHLLPQCGSVPERYWELTG